MKKKSLRIYPLLVLTITILSIVPAKSLVKEDSVQSNKYREVANQIVTSALKERKGYEALRNFCIIGPRLSGSRNSLIAINWAKNKMIESGLDTVWLQPVKVPHWERGNVEKAIIMNSIKFNGKELNILALGGSIGTPTEGIFANVIEVRSFEELEKRKGKRVMTNGNLIEKEILLTLKELLKWAKVSSYGDVKKMLESVLDVENKRVIYYLSNGENNQDQIVEKGNVAAGSVSKYWREWEKLGINPCKKNKLGFKTSLPLKDNTKLECWIIIDQITTQLAYRIVFGGKNVPCQ
ncbi:MAG: hypothetical protein IIB08_08550 [Bacteroidetes bacterium]|nr:hypothetical protein [Bacteroidota bacterium]